MSIVSPNIIDREINRYGSSVILRINTASTTSEYGDTFYSTSDSTITAIHNDIQGDEEFNKEGIYKPGDKVFFIKSDQSNLKVGNSIIFDSSIYRIKEIVAHHIGSSDFVQEIRCSKVD